MVNALIKLSEDANRVLNIVKARFGLKDKGEAIEFIISKYSEEENEPELRPDFVEKIRKTEHQKGFEFRSVNELRAKYNGL
ncbi:MAG: DUF2683 family protein [Nanoarchaeota archaeon]